MLESYNLGLINSDSRGIAISMDLLLALIPLTLAIGIIGADMDNMLYLVQDTVYRSSTDRVAHDTVNALLETSGQPTDWEKTGNPTVPGLARFDESKGAPVEGTMTAAKLAALKDSDIQNMIGNDYDFFLKVIGENSTSGSTLKTMGNSTGRDNAKDVVKVERIVLYSKLEVISQLVGEIRGNGTARPYDMKDFSTSYYSNQTYDYYIFIVNSGFTNASITINSDTMTLNSTTINEPALINSYIKMNSTNPNTFYNNKVTITAGSSKSSAMDVYVVIVPKGTTKNEINYNNIKPKGYRFQFYLWTK